MKLYIPTFKDGLEDVCSIGQFAYKSFEEALETEFSFVVEMDWGKCAWEKFLEDTYYTHYPTMFGRKEQFLFRHAGIEIEEVDLWEKA